MCKLLKVELAFPKKKFLFEKQSCLRLGFKESGNDSRKRVWKALLNETFLIVSD
jgi:hypothetical protein